MNKISSLFPLVFFLLMLPAGLQAQEGSPGEETNKGMFSLGARNVISMFSDGEFNHRGLGMGGQFRLRLSDRINTEWYADFANTNILDKAFRTDYHIGWSVFYYLLKEDRPHPRLLQPFMEAGHCFDYTRVVAAGPFQSLERWSSAVQMGVGSHINFTEKFDFTVKVQYMIHLGSDIDVHLVNDVVTLEKHEGVDLEGHILITFSVNYKIGHLW